VDLVRAEAELSPGPPRANTVDVGAEAGGGEAVAAAEEGVPARGSSRRSVVSASGAATATMVSPRVLQGLRSSLRKTGNLTQ